MIILKYKIKYIEYIIRKIISMTIISDYQYQHKKLSKISKRNINILNPITLSEKICHRMIYDHNPLYTYLADKLSARDFVYSRTDNVKLIPLIGVYRRSIDLDFSKLPDRFVLKCNHDSGSAIICTDKKKLNIPLAMNKLSLALKKNMYYITREWQYKDIEPVIICEKYIDLYSGNDQKIVPEMLRIHCFHGVAKFIEVDFSDKSGEYINIYNTSWQIQPFNMEYPNTPYEITKPKSFDMAIIESQKLSSGINYCRIDLMIYHEDIYFSEITLSPRRGLLEIFPQEWDMKLGKMW